MIAIHSVVGADEVWGLLPRLKARGRLGHPRPADREDRPVSATHRRRRGPRRLDASRAPRPRRGRSRRPRRPPRPRRARPPRRRPRPGRPRRRPATLADVRARGDDGGPRGQRSRSVAAGRTAGSSSIPTTSAPRATRLEPARPPRARPGDRPRPPLRRDPATDLDPDDDRPRHRDRAPLDAARRASAPTSPAGPRPTRRRW